MCQFINPKDVRFGKNEENYQVSFIASENNKDRNLTFINPWCPSPEEYDKVQDKSSQVVLITICQQPENKKIGLQESARFRTCIDFEDGSGIYIRCEKISGLTKTEDWVWGGL
jgi:hypothetical protein